MEEVFDDEYQMDIIKGESGKKRKMDVLNKTKLSKYEMDDLFIGGEKYDEE